MLLALSQNIQAEASDKIVDDNGRAIIKQFEGLKLKAYKCSSGQSTIGYGHANSSMRRITVAQADSLLKVDLKQIEKVLNRYDFNQSQFNAIASFIYNIGINAFLNSTFAKTLNVEELRKWVYSNGKRLSGLVKRRESEIKLYNNWTDDHFHNWINKYRYEINKEFYISRVDNNFNRAA